MKQFHNDDSQAVCVLDDIGWLNQDILSKTWRFPIFMKSEN